MNNIQKGLSYYHMLLAEIGDKDKPVMNAKDFEVRSMEALHNAVRTANAFLNEKGIFHKDRLNIVLQELKGMRQIAMEIKDQFLEGDDTSKQKQDLATYVVNQIDGLIFFHNTTKRTSGKK